MDCEGVEAIEGKKVEEKEGNEREGGEIEKDREGKRRRDMVKWGTGIYFFVGCSLDDESRFLRSFLFSVSP